jgi:mRNA interferase RelE/StbE
VYEILIERTAERDLKSLPAGIFKRLVSRINALPENPRPPGSHKLAGSKNDWRIRVGDYRVVYDIDDPRKRARIFRVRHRREVYR